MQLYTGVGDKGKTKLVGNDTVSKNSVRVEAYGTVDELNSLVGVVQSSPEIWEEASVELLQIQQFLFDCGNDLATPRTKKYPYRAGEKAVQWLEERIDQYAREAEPIESFILPGGTRLAAELHYCRTVARRAERKVVGLSERIKNKTYDSGREETPVNPYVLTFLNRVSDYFFAIARVANARANVKDITYERSGKVFHLDAKKEDFQ